MRVLRGGKQKKKKKKKRCRLNARPRVHRLKSCVIYICLHICIYGPVETVGFRASISYNFFFRFFMLDEIARLALLVDVYTRRVVAFAYLSSAYIGTN